MKKIVPIVSLICFFLVSCTDSWRIEQNAKTLAGSVTSINSYHAEGLFDGESFGDQFTIFNCIQKSNNSLQFTLLQNSGTLTKNTDVAGIATSEIMLSGSVGDVLFDSIVEVTVNATKYKGRASGWIQSDVPTKTTPAQYNLKCEITLQWVDSADKSHTLIINRVFF